MIGMLWMRWKWLVLLALVALLVVVVGVASLALDTASAPPPDHVSQRQMSGASATAASSTTTLPSVPTLVPADYIPPGWRQAGPGFAQDIAFAASNPAIGYICGTQAGTVMVASSADGGTTWSAPVAVDSGYDCAITIDPLHAGSLAMTIQPCSANGCPPGTPAFAVLERSGDNGATWTQASLPTDGSQMGFGAQIAWADDTLFAQILAGDNVVPRHYLAASVAGGGFAWADANVAFAQPATQLSLLAGSGATLYAGFTQAGVAASCMSPSLANVIATTDNGQTWSSILFTIQGKPVALSVIAPDGKTLIGVGADGRFVASHDDGQTWQPTPVVPPQMQACAIFVAPDGTFIAQFTATLTANAEASEVDIAPPGATAWHTLSVGTTNIMLAMLSPVANGQALTLWATTVGNLAPYKLVDFTVVGS